MPVTDATDDAAVLLEMQQLVAAGDDVAKQAMDSFKRDDISKHDFVQFSRMILMEQAEIIREAALTPHTPVHTGPEGFLFMCSSKTYDECIKRSLLGENGGKLSSLRSTIEPGITPLFLLHFGKRLLCGPFYATAPPAMNLEADAWVGGQTRAGRRSGGGGGGGGDGRSPYPAQVRICRDGPVRQWKLPGDVHLTAGKLDAVQTAQFLRDLPRRGHTAREAEQIPVKGSAAAAASSSGGGRAAAAMQPQPRAPAAAPAPPPVSATRPPASAAAPVAAAPVAATPASRPPAAPPSTQDSLTSGGHSTALIAAASAAAAAAISPASAASVSAACAASVSASTASGGSEAEGFLFMCSSKTYDECIKRSLLGENGGKLSSLRSTIEPGITPLFLLHFGKRLLCGPFYATAPPAMNLEADAWVGGQTRAGRRSGGGGGGGGDGRSPYPAQVRICRDGPVRQWKLPGDVHLTAGKLDAVQTAQFLRDLPRKGSIAREADSIALKALKAPACQLAPSASDASPRTRGRRGGRRGAGAEWDSGDDAPFDSDGETTTGGLPAPSPAPAPKFAEDPALWAALSPDRGFSLGLPPATTVPSGPPQPAVSAPSAVASAALAPAPPRAIAGVPPSAASWVPAPRPPPPPLSKPHVLIDCSSVAAAHQPLEMGYLNVMSVHLAKEAFLNLGYDVTCLIPSVWMTWRSRSSLEEGEASRRRQELWTLIKEYKLAEFAPEDGGPRGLPALVHCAVSAEKAAGPCPARPRPRHFRAWSAACARAPHCRPPWPQLPPR